MSGYDWLAVAGLAWLAAVSFFVALCAVAGRADDAMERWARSGTLTVDDEPEDETEDAA